MAQELQSATPYLKAGNTALGWFAGNVQDRGFGQQIDAYRDAGKEAVEAAELRAAQERRVGHQRAVQYQQAGAKEREKGENVSSTIRARGAASGATPSPTLTAKPMAEARFREAMATAGYMNAQEQSRFQQALAMRSGAMQQRGYNARAKGLQTQMRYQQASRGMSALSGLDDMKSLWKKYGESKPVVVGPSHHIAQSAWVPDYEQYSYSRPADTAYDMPSMFDFGS